MGLITKLFGTYSEKQIKKITPLVDEIEALSDKFHSLSDEEMKEYTARLKARLKEGETLDDILPEAFALVREADERVLGKRPYRVQLIGGILLHQGRVAEMKTGEGKTLVATLPAYLNALAGEGVHIVTVNPYLAERDSDEMGRVYEYLGLSVGLVAAEQSFEEKQAAYLADITYGTNSEYGFDYLRDNREERPENMVQRGHFFAIVDEVDSILIDEARNPLIISGMMDEPKDLYLKADAFVRTLSKRVIKEVDTKEDLDQYEEDYVVDEKARTAVLTGSGIEKAERYFKIENLSDPENTTIYHHINIAIQAHGVMKLDIDYVVDDGGVFIVDQSTGRVLAGRRYNDGLHQAIEAKEGVEVQRESVTMATITYQNYFRMYKKLSGMTGTALTEDEEFKQIYALDVVEVPTNRPMIRIDRNDMVFGKRETKLKAIVQKIKECNAKGQPVLVGTISVERSEELSKILNKEKIRHNVLNAKNHGKEADIIASAGTVGAVTIATNMAGRGTDIMLGGNPEYLAKLEMRKKGYDDELIYEATGTRDTEDEALLEARSTYASLYEKFKKEIAPERERVIDAGGLCIIGTERHESRRVDNQLRGRSGRQGDPGESQFYVSFEDDLMRLFGGSLAEIAKNTLERNGFLNLKMMSSVIETAQKRHEAANFHRRKNVLMYDDVMNEQRKVIYTERMELLKSENLGERIEGMIISSVERAVNRFFPEDDRSKWSMEGFFHYYRGLVRDKRNLQYSTEEIENIDREALKDELKNSALEVYRMKEKLFADLPNCPISFRQFEKSVFLNSVDRLWIKHLESMEDLKSYVGLNSYAQRDPFAMYRIQGADMFDELIEDIKELTVRNILASFPRENLVLAAKGVSNLRAGFIPGAKTTRRVPIKSVKVGNNEKCPCGSGKSYKDCCRRAKIMAELEISKQIAATESARKNIERRGRR